MNLTEDEAEIYDRQIRLWGLDAQKRLRSATILIAGLGGLGAEISKNIILAGVKAVTLLDHRMVSANDTAQFLFNESDTGKNRAEASKSSAEALNPMVVVSSDTDSLDDKPDEFFGAFTVVCIVGYPPPTLIKVNKACRSQKVNFFCCDTWGLYGFGFVDLGTHSFVEERKVGTTSKTKDDNSMKVEVMQKVFEYPTLEKSLTIKAGKFGFDKKTSPVFSLMHVMFKFFEQHGRNPEVQQIQKDKKELLNLKKEILPQLSVDISRLDDAIFDDVFGEVSPVCAVVGGIIAQDIIKAVSGKDSPIMNYFLFNGDSCCGVVEHIGK